MPWPNAPLVSFTMSLFEGEMRDEDVIASEILVEVVDPYVSSIKEGVEFVADMPWSNSPEGSFSMTLLDAEIKDDDLITSEIVTEVDDVGCPDVCSIEEGVKVVVVTVGGDSTTLSTEDSNGDIVKVMKRQMKEMQKQLMEKQMNEMNAMQKQMMGMTNMQRQMMQKQMNQMNAVKCWPGQFGITHNATARRVNLHEDSYTTIVDIQWWDDHPSTRKTKLDF